MRRNYLFLELYKVRTSFLTLFARSNCNCHVYSKAANLIKLPPPLHYDQLLNILVRSSLFSPKGKYIPKKTKTLPCSTSKFDQKSAVNLFFFFFFPKCGVQGFGYSQNFTLSCKFES